jgi:hypothetical protein
MQHELDNKISLGIVTSLFLENDGDSNMASNDET